MSDKEIIDTAVKISHIFYCIAIMCGIVSIIDCIVKVVIEKGFDLKHPIREITNIIYGKEYIVKVNGVWSVCRGKRVKKPSLDGWLKIKYGPDKHRWMLSYTCWNRIGTDWSEEKIERHVVEANIDELKKAHPKKKKIKRITDEMPIIDNFISYFRPRWTGDE